MTRHLSKHSLTASLQNLHRNLGKNLWTALPALYEPGLRVRLTSNRIGETTLYKQRRSAEHVSAQLATWNTLRQDSPDQPPNVVLAISLTERQEAPQ